jgi:hypothetical protein
MRAFHYLNLSTLVLLAALLVPRISQGATETPSPDFNEPPAKKEEISSENKMILNSIDIAPPPPAPEKINSDDFFYSYRRALIIRAGALYDTEAAQNGTSNPLVDLGLGYLFPDEKWKSLEAGADLLSDGTGVLHLEKRFEFSRTRFRPYLKAGAGLRVDPSDQLATFLKYQNYQLRGAAGFDQLIQLPASLRIEIESTISTKTVQIGLSIGAVWAY